MRTEQEWKNLESERDALILAVADHVTVRSEQYAQIEQYKADIARLESQLGGLGAVLTYSTTGHNKPCGQTVGANGAGDFSILIYGSPEEAWKLARDHLERMERAGYKIDEALIVPNYEGYSGPFITTVQSTNAGVTGSGEKI